MGAYQEPQNVHANLRKHLITTYVYAEYIYCILYVYTYIEYNLPICIFNAQSRHGDAEPGSPHVTGPSE